MRFKNWLKQLQELFGNKAPNHEYSDEILSKVLAKFGVELVEYIGAGDNGIVFITNTEEVVKFTIDKQEAFLWHRLKGKELSGITGLRDVINLSSSTKGDSVVYAIKAEYAPNPITAEQESLIRAAKSKAEAAMQRRVIQVRNDEISSDQYIEYRTLSLVTEFQRIAEIDDSLDLVPEMLIDLADKYGSHIYDLQPANFRRDSKGKVVLIDPSVPNLFGTVEKPTELQFENKLAFALEVSYIIID